MPAKSKGSDRDLHSTSGEQGSGAQAALRPPKATLRPRGQDAFHQGLASVVQAMPSMAVIVDQDLNRMFCSPSAEAFLGSDVRQLRSSLAYPLRPYQTLADVRVLVLKGALGVRQCFRISAIPALHGTEERMYLLIEDDQPDGTLGSDTRYLMEGSSPTLKLQEEAARFKRLSETDPLTGVLNVRAFALRVRQALKDRPWRQGALLFLDLNRFKDINDAYGHAAGDLVLTHVARRLTFPPQTWIATARVGGDEFALWMPGVRQESLEEVVIGLRARLELPVSVNAQNRQRVDVTVTASIGAACCPGEAQDYDKLKALADLRMYEDKPQ